MKKYTTILFALALAGTLFTGCRKKNVEPTTMPPVSTEPSSMATTAPTTAPTQTPSSAPAQTESMPNEDGTMPGQESEPSASGETQERRRTIPHRN